MYLSLLLLVLQPQRLPNDPEESVAMPALGILKEGDMHVFRYQKELKGILSTD